MSDRPSGKVLRLDHRSASGQQILMAVTPENRELARVECDDDDMDAFIEMLWGALDRHHARTTMRAASSKRRRGRAAATQANDSARPLALVR